MKILQVYHIYPELFGGVSTVVYQVTRELCKRGHEVHVLTTDAYFKGKESREKEVKVYRFRLVSQMLSKYNLIVPEIKFIPYTKRLIKEYDCIHIHGYRNLYNEIIRHFAVRHRVPYILQAHGSIPRKGKWVLKLTYDALFGYRLLKDASKVIALNKVEAQQYRSIGVPEDKITIIPNGIDLSEYAELPPKGAFKKKFNIPGDKKIILYLGRIHKTKGIDFLVRAYAYLTKKMNFKDAVLIIAGPDDGYLNEVKALASSLGVYNSTIFTGFLSNENKLKALVDADVFVTPSFYGFPITFLEACAVGTPIVTTSLGDMLEWIDGKVGYVTRPTCCDLAEALYRIVSDDELCRKFSRNCIEVVRSYFLLEKVVERLEEIYKEVVESMVYETSDY